VNKHTFTEPSESPLSSFEITEFKLLIRVAVQYETREMFESTGIRDSVSLEAQII
jgi:hypothetical protein